MLEIVIQEIIRPIEDLIEQYEVSLLWMLSKIEKVPRGIRGEKSSKDMASSRNLVSTIGALASHKSYSDAWPVVVVS